MALDVYFREDVARVLSAIQVAGGSTVALVDEEVSKAIREGYDLDSDRLAEHVRIYRDGFRAALAAIALAFGIVPYSHAINTEIDPELLPIVDDFRPPVCGP